MLLKTAKINKQFNGIYALRNVDFEMMPEEIHPSEAFGQVDGCTDFPELVTVFNQIKNYLGGV